MRRIPTSLFKTCLVLLTAVAWFAASNHCALAVTVFSPQPNTGSIHIPCHDKGDKSAEVDCCKVLKATPSEIKTAPVPQPFLTGVFDYAIVFRFDFNAPEVLLAAAMPTGPPDVRSFTELVLNRSLLAHAPPVFVA